jgi:hypothetical protein
MSAKSFVKAQSDGLEQELGVISLFQTIRDNFCSRLPLATFSNVELLLVVAV